MKLNIYQIDAFSKSVFGGNPAAVVPLESWPDDTTMQKIAEENNLSETAFLAPEGEGFRLRWFTPVAEVDLCGHATLASAFVLFDILKYDKDAIVFETRSGKLNVTKESDGALSMDFPSKQTTVCETPQALCRALGIAPIQTLVGTEYVAVLKSAKEVKNLNPDFSLLAALDKRAVMVTAEGNDCDFVSRFFAPKLGVNEDPVTGSAHCALAPYWASRLNKTTLHAKQLSKRGGEIECKLAGDRVMLRGYAVRYMSGEIEI